MCHYFHLLSIDDTIMVSENCPIIGKHAVIIFITLHATIATAWPAKNTLNFSFKYLNFENGTVNFVLLSNFGKKDEMQLLAKFKNILYIRFRLVILSFRNFKVALNPTYRIFSNFAKSCILSCLSKFDITKKFTMPAFLKYKRLKLKLTVF